MSHNVPSSTPRDGSPLLKGKRPDLIELIAATLHSVKAYDLPAECERLGLATGTGSEAHSSKRVYVRSRLQGLSNDQLLQLARQVEQDHVSFSLSEFLRLLDESSDGQAVTELTRRSILKLLNDMDLFGELPLVEQLSKIWPLPEIRGAGFEANLEESVIRHCVNNDDWTNAELLEVVGALSSSRQLFFKLLEAVVSPNARRGKEQTQLVETLNAPLKADGFQLRPSGSISGYSAFAVCRISGGVSGAPKNLIFASTGPKPEIVIQDAINNDIRIVKNEEHCLVYDRPMQASGLTKEEMLSWWKERQGTEDESDARRSLSQRLMASLASDGERNVFSVYYRAFKDLGDKLPALIPQVYLHYDPYTLAQLGGVGRLSRQRMDFLLLFSDAGRVVVEVDGSQHFAEDGKPSLARYADMVAADRDLRLAGYEVYRFGANELTGHGSAERIEAFFRRLLRKHAVLPGPGSAE